MNMLKRTQCTVFINKSSIKDISLVGLSAVFLLAVSGCGGSMPGGSTSTQGLTEFTTVSIPNLTSAYFSNYYFDIFATSGNQITVFKRNGSNFNQGETIGTSEASANFGSMSAPMSVSVDSIGDVLVADTGNNRVEIFFPNNAEFTARTAFGTSGTGSGQFQKVVSVAADSSNNVYAVDETQNIVEDWNYNGGSYTFNKNIGAGALSDPVSIAVDSNNNLYVSNAGGKNILVFSSSTGNVVNTISAPASLASTFVPGYLSLDANNDIYVADTGNMEIEKFSFAGGTYTYSGVVGSIGSGASQYQNPSSVSVDTYGDIFVGDSGNNRVAIFPPQ